MNRTTKIIVEKIIIIISFLIVMKGCFGIFYWKMTHLSDDDLEWWNASKRYPTATFESDSGRKAYYHVWSKYKNNITNPFYWKISAAGKDTYEARAGYDYVIRQDSNKIEGYFSISRSLDDDSLMTNSSLNGFHPPRELYLYDELERDHITLGNRTFGNCLVIDTTKATTYNEEIGCPREKGLPVKYIISKEYGLIYYELDNGEKFYRKFPNTD